MEYGEEDFEDEERESDEELTRLQDEILAAETDEIWLEEPADENDPHLPPNMPFPGMFPPIIPMGGAPEAPDEGEDK